MNGLNHANIHYNQYNVGRKYFNYPVLMVFYGVAEMVMGSAYTLRVLLFESAPEYGDFRGDTFLLVCP